MTSEFATLALLAVTVCGLAPLLAQQPSTASGVSDERVIPGVPQLRWGIGNQCSVIGAMCAALKAMDEKISYNDLMGTSGAAFRLCFAQPQWDFSSVDGMLSHDHASVALKALGYSQAIIAGGGNPNEPQHQVARQQIIDSIDAGRPAIGIDLVVAPEWAVIAGYEEEGKTWICRSYFDADAKVDRRPDGLVRSGRWPWIRVIFGPKIKPLTARESLLQAIEVAVTFDREDEYFTSGGGARYARGLTAYRVWANDLLDENRFGEEQKALRDWKVNSFCFDALLDARLAAAEYLEKYVPLLDGSDRAHLVAAAAGYRAIANQLQGQGLLCVPRYAPGDPAAKWTQMMRDDQAALLKQCAAQEKQALAELAAIGK